MSGPLGDDSVAIEHERLIVDLLHHAELERARGDPAMRPDLDVRAIGDLELKALSI
jgi:hypothetical protein